ncbi:MAG: transglycosylase domain-containing protein [Gammaproteobacteria bacterium]|nr:transglycosylase domain-containing protein [Gammaproteobacteria bacterium]
MRAALHLASSEVQGASTLTMQLARNLFPRSTACIRRKAR